MTTRNLAENGKMLKEYIPELRDDSETASGIWTSEYRANIDAYTIKSMFFNEDWVFIIVDLLANEISASRLKVMVEEVIDGKKKQTPDEGYWLQKLLDNPNGLQTQSAFIYRSFVEFFLGGNFIAWYSRAAQKIWPLGFEAVQLYFSQYNATLDSYIWHDTDEYSQVRRGGMLRFPAQDVLHIRRPNPVSLYWGLSPFIPGRKSVLFNRYSQDYINNYFLKGALPGMVLESEGTYNVEQLDRLTKSFEQQYTGRRNQRRTLALPKGVKANPVSHTIAEQGLIDLINQNRETILNILRVPKHAVSLQETGSLGSEEHKVALAYMWIATIKPAQKAYEEALNQFFKPELMGTDGKKRVIVFDNSEVEVLHEDLTKKAELATKMLSSMTLNEVRAEVWNLPALPGGDALPRVSQPGAPTFPGEQVPAQALPANSSQSPASVPEETDAPIDVQKWKERYQKEFEAHLKGIDEEVAKKRGPMEELAGDTIVEMARIAIGLVKDSAKEKADFDLTALREKLQAGFDSLSPKWEDLFVRSLESSVDLGYKQQLGLILNGQARDAIDALGMRDRAGRRRTLRARGIESFAHVSDTTTEAVMRQVEEGQRQNRSVSEIARSILSYFSERAWTRAQTIARTETLTAVSIGQAGVLKATAQQFPNVLKVWITANDERVRGRPGGLYADSEADHWALHGQKRKPNQPFANGLQYPRDPKSGKASEVINCRCTLITVLPEDIGDLTPNVNPGA